MTRKEAEKQFEDLRNEYAELCDDRENALDHLFYIEGELRELQYELNNCNNDGHAEELEVERVNLEDNQVELEEQIASMDKQLYKIDKELLSLYPVLQGD